MLPLHYTRMNLVGCRGLEPRMSKTQVLQTRWTTWSLQPMKLAGPAPLRGRFIGSDQPRRLERKDSDLHLPGAPGRSGLSYVPSGAQGWIFTTDLPYNRALSRAARAYS